MIKKFISKDNKVVCCDNSRDLDDSFSSAMTVIDDNKSLRQKIAFLKELIDLKDKVILDKTTIITDKEVIIKLLGVEISYLKEKYDGGNLSSSTDASSKPRDVNLCPNSTNIITNNLTFSKKYAIFQKIGNKKIAIKLVHSG